MTAAVKNLVIEQKAAFEKRLTFKDKLKRLVEPQRHSKDSRSELPV